MPLEHLPGITRETERFHPDHRYEPISENLIRFFYSGILQPGDTALDVGVHYGIHLFPMARKVGPAGKVIGIEASKERFEAMSRKSAQENLPQIELHHVAASNATGEAQFFLNRSFTGRSGLMRNAKTETDEISEITVATDRLDRLLQELSALRFIKLDIEGAEAAALAGAAGLIERLEPIIVYEGRLEKSIAKLAIDPGELRVIFEGYAHYDMFGELLHPGRAASGWNFIAVPDRADETEKVAAALQSAWAQVLQGQG